MALLSCIFPITSTQASSLHSTHCLREKIQPGKNTKCIPISLAFVEHREGIAPLAWTDVLDRSRRRAGLYPPQRTRRGNPCMLPNQGMEERQAGERNTCSHQPLQEGRPGRWNSEQPINHSPMSSRSCRNHWTIQDAIEKGAVGSMTRARGLVLPLPSQCLGCA